MEIGKEITEAVTQSSVQYRSSREALKKARVLEQQEKNKEARRMEKELAAQKKKDEKEKEKREKAEARKQAQAKAKDTSTTETAEAMGDEGDQKTSKRRRGRGTEEIGEQDPGVLCNKFSGKEVSVVDCHEEFLKTMSHGSPVVWRARRAPLKKILELSEEFEQKDITKAPVALHGDLKAFMESFVNALQSDPEKIKNTKATSDDFQKFHDAFTLEHQMQKLLESQMDESTRDPRVNRKCMILDRLHVHDDIQAKANGTEDQDGGGKPVGKPVPNKAAEQAGLLWDKLHMVAHQHLKCFTGAINGLLPHLIYQMEGTKVISMVKISDVPCQHVRDVIMI